jgi:hypothetical protein
MIHTSACIFYVYVDRVQTHEMRRGMKMEDLLLDGGSSSSGGGGYVNITLYQLAVLNCLM